MIMTLHTNPICLIFKTKCQIRSQIKKKSRKTIPPEHRNLYFLHDPEDHGKPLVHHASSPHTLPPQPIPNTLPNLQHRLQAEKLRPQPRNLKNPVCESREDINPPLFFRLGYPLRS